MEAGLAAWCSVHHIFPELSRREGACDVGLVGGRPLFLASPGRIFLQKELHELPGYVQGEHALCHLLQDPQVVAVGGGEPVHAADGATKY